MYWYTQFVDVRIPPPPHKIDSITMVTGFLPSVFEFWNILYLTGSCPLIINYLLAFSFFFFLQMQNHLVHQCKIEECLICDQKVQILDKKMHGVCPGTFRPLSGEKN